MSTPINDDEPGPEASNDQVQPQPVPSQPALPLAEREEVGKFRHRGQEVEHSPDVPSVIDEAARSTEIPGATLVTALMRATPFYDLFCHHANARFPDKAATARVGAMRDNHRTYHQVCLICDWFARATLFLVLVGLIVLVIYRTLVAR